MGGLQVQFGEYRIRDRAALSVGKEVKGPILAQIAEGSFDDRRDLLLRHVQKTKPADHSADRSIPIEFVPVEQGGVHPEHPCFGKPPLEQSGEVGTVFDQRQILLSHTACE
ncbi:hypothetical protein A1351_23275 [Methylosinus sp. R-45379]|nr:hypothetical protein A1351_23275 [Methylosinus sp. R-45379]